MGDEIGGGRVWEEAGEIIEKREKSTKEEGQRVWGKLQEDHW